MAERVVPKVVLPWRQVHLDFHTSEHVPNVGAGFDGDAFAARLLAANVESIVLFAKCHHGWSYYDTRVGARHPTLEFDLLSAQVEACRAAGIKTVIYISVGWDERSARDHVDWRQVAPDGSFRCLLGGHLDAAWKYLCLGTPYLDYLTAQIDEVVRAFPDADGLWLDIIKQEPCCCVHCQAGATAAGLDWLKESDRDVYRKTVLQTYLDRSVQAALAVRPDMPVFHNTSMVPRGDRTFFESFSHIEIESLPTGGWGYDHLPMAAKYAGTLPYDRLGVTARFHIVWGELGAWKHPNALRYEVCAMLTHGVKVCIGDHLDPTGMLDTTSYRMIGDVFAEVEEKRPWCEGSVNVADVALLSAVSVRSPGSINRADRHAPEDEGALRILSEGHILFDVIDADANFSAYGALVLPDRVRIAPELKHKLDDYLANGGKLLLTAESGLAADNSGFALAVGANLLGPSPFNPTFIAPRDDLRPDWISDPFMIFAPSMRIRATEGTSLGAVYEPYFNRSPHHFNGHINAAAKTEPSGYDCGVRHGNVTYLAQPVFSLYRELGSVAIKRYVLAVLSDLLGASTMATEGLPAAGTATLRRLPDGRHVAHLLYATPTLKGQTVLGPLEVVEDLPSVGPVTLTLPVGPTRARLEPQGIDLAVADGKVIIDRFACHQMVVFS
jgi:hypothetical protein